MRKGVISAVFALLGAAVGTGIVAVAGKRVAGELEKAKGMSDKHQELFLMMNQWVKVKQEGGSPAAYLEKKGYKKIAIYGMGHAGETLLDELRDTGVAVAYAIDRNADRIYTNVDVVSMESGLAPVDAVVVTAVASYGEIEEALGVKLDCPVLSLEDILYDL